VTVFGRWEARSVTKLGVKVIDEHEFRRLLAGDD